VGGVASRDQETDTSVVHARACCDECRPVPAKLSENKMPDAAASALAAIEREWRKRVDRARTNSHRSDALPVGILLTLGYRVGSTNGAPTTVRRRILKHVLDGQLALVDSLAYTANGDQQIQQSDIQSLFSFCWNEDFEWVRHILSPFPIGVDNPTKFEI
jgi:hypothetical protein